MLRRAAALALLVCLLLASCGETPIGDRDFRQDMRDFVGGISDYARESHPGFVVIPQNGHALLTEDGEQGGAPASAYIAAIDGVGREDLFYGYVADDQATPVADRDAMAAFMDLAVSEDLAVLVIDYCSTHSLMDDSYARSAAGAYISFAAPDRGLGSIPDYPAAPYNSNAADVAALGEARNFLYLLSPDTALYPTKEAYLAALAATDYDLFILDLFYESDEGEIVALSPSDLSRLRTKPSGGTRLLVCYMSIGEAEDYRFYWESSWRWSPPSWLEGENPEWEGNYKVRYWDPGWQAVIFGDSGAYLDRILDSGFDGVYLDIIDAYEYFEEQDGT